jgi:hypothetical protein
MTLDMKFWKRFVFGFYLSISDSFGSCGYWGLPRPSSLVLLWETSWLMRRE